MYKNEYRYKHKRIASATKCYARVAYKINYYQTGLTKTILYDIEEEKKEFLRIARKIRKNLE